MPEERPGRLIAFRHGLRRLTRRDPSAWAVLGTTSLVGLVIAVALTGVASGPGRTVPTFSMPPGMGAVVGGIEACHDSGPPPGGYPFVAGTAALYRGHSSDYSMTVAIGTAAANADFVILAPPGDYQLAPYANLPNPPVSVTVRSGQTTFQDLRSAGCI